MEQPAAGQKKTFVPFTKAERIQQLGEIDKVSCYHCISTLTPNLQLLNLYSRIS